MSLPARFQRARHPLGAPPRLHRPSQALRPDVHQPRSIPLTVEASLEAIAEGPRLAQMLREILRSKPLRWRRPPARRTDSTSGTSVFVPFYPFYRVTLGGTYASTG